MKPRTRVEWAAYSTWYAIVAGMIAFIVFNGCFASVDEITAKPHGEWTSREGLTVAVSNARTNAADQNENFMVTVLPLTPDVALSFAAMNRYRQGWDSVKAKEHLDAVLLDYCGLLLDEDGTLWTPAHGRYAGPEDLDSLLFVVILRNRTYPCQAPHFNGVPLMRQADVPCEMEDISDIEKRISLVTERGDTLKPSMVAGRERGILIYEELLFVRFRLDGRATPTMRFSIDRDKKDIAFDLAFGEQK